MRLTHITAVLGWLGYCFCGYAAFLVGYTIWKRHAPTHAQWWMKKLARLREPKGRIKGWVLSPVTSWLFGISCLAFLVGAAYRLRSNIVTEHNVAIYGQDSDGDWRMSSDEERDLVFRPCPEDTRQGVDVNSLLAQGVGYIADYASWEERGTCKSILSHELGFWFKDEHNNFTYRRIANR